MAARPFHMAWFTPFKTPSWRTPWSGEVATEWFTGEYHIDMARALERAGFDFMMFEDSTLVSEAYGGTAENDLKHGLHSPKGDPIPLLPILARETRDIGFIGTMSTSFYQPFLVARTMATLDHLTRGRIGWNIVTSSEDVAAQNYGIEKLLPHDERYEQAQEFTDVVKRLWDSWEPGAIVADRETGSYADYTKVHPIHHKGKYFSVRGPLNLPPGPQGHPTICQAGGSPRGRDFAAANADCLLTASNGIAKMKEFREDIRSRAVAHGRNADDIKVLYIVQPVLAESDEAAQELAAFRDKVDQDAIEIQLGFLSILTELDFKAFDLDEELPEGLTTNGHQTTLDSFVSAAKGKTLREAVSGGRTQAVPLIGTPASVAAQMEEVMDEVGGDGFLVRGEPRYSHTRRYVDEIASGLAPELRRRGLIRTEYTGKTLKENLRAF